MVVVCGRGGPWRREDPAAHGGRYLRHHGLGVQGGRFAWSAADRGREGCRVQWFTAQHGAVTTVGCAAAPPRQRRRGRVPDADRTCRQSERIHAENPGSQTNPTHPDLNRHFGLDLIDQRTGASLTRDTSHRCTEISSVRECTDGCLYFPGKAHHRWPPVLSGWEPPGDGDGPLGRVARISCPDSSSAIRRCRLPTTIP